MRKPPVNKHGLAEACAFAAKWKMDESAVRDLLQVYLAACRSPTGIRKQRHAKSTLALAAMEVGQVIHIEVMAPQSLRARMKFARVLMDNPSARWITQTLTTGEFRVTRLEDNASTRRESHNPITTALVQLKPGQSVLIPEIKPSGSRGPTPSSSYLISARKKLNDFEAKWSFKTTNHGVRATRIR